MVSQVPEARPGDPARSPHCVGFLVPVLGTDSLATGLWMGFATAGMLDLPVENHAIPALPQMACKDGTPETGIDCLGDLPQ